MYQDKEIVCKDCGKTFIFTAGEQEFYAEKGFQNEPKCCKECRSEKKRGAKEYFIGSCTRCGGEAKVPFKPTEGRPIYCSECYAKMKEEAGE